MRFSVDAIFSFLFAFFVSLSFLPLVYNILKRVKAKQTILEYVDMHKGKAGTPTMGGIAFVLGTAVSVVALISGYSKMVLIALCVMLLNSLVGFYDDYKKIKRKHNEGLKPWQKLLFQFIIFGLFGFYLYKKDYTFLIIPFLKTTVDFGFAIIFIVVIVGIFFTNCTNLADGLDGLECFIAVPLSCLLGVFLGLIATSGNFDFIKNAENLHNCAIALMIFSGAIFSFFFYNSYPAKIFMGDTGSLAVGAFLVSISVVSGTLLYLLIFGIMFVITGVSVMMQVAYYKLTKKRIFLMAPLHHHFEKKGYHEAKIGMIYFMVTTIVSLLIIFVEFVWCKIKNYA